MRHKAVNLLALAICLGFALSLLPSRGYAADRRPYFKTFGADVMSGGWFSSGITCDTDPSSHYQDGRNSVDHLTGGILGYAKSAGSNSAGGASSQFAAFALGLIEGNGATNRGFYSNSAGGGYVGGRTFANNSAAPWGGYFQDDQFDGVRQSLCIPDYYSKKPADVDTPVLGGLNGGTASGIYRASGVGSPFNLTPGGPVQMNNSKNITVYVDGNVYIDRNITYNSGAAGSNVSNIPKFTLIARGSIYIGPGVTELYGFYIAQPLPDCTSGALPCSSNPETEDTGIIWTCHPNNAAPLFYTWPIDNNCTNRLVITGGLVAKQVNFIRFNGDVGSASSAEDSLAGAMASGNISEIINYSPAVPLNGPFLTKNDPAAQRNKIDSVISLPPIF